MFAPLASRPGNRGRVFATSPSLIMDPAPTMKPTSGEVTGRMWALVSAESVKLEQVCINLPSWLREDEIADFFAGSRSLMMSPAPEMMASSVHEEGYSPPTLVLFVLSVM